MEIFELIDRLDNLVYEAKGIPFTDTVRLERDPVFQLLDQIRVVVPEELKRAQAIIDGRGTLATPDREESEELRRIASTLESLQRSQRPTPPPLTAVASEQVREIVETAERTAAEIRKEADAEAAKTRDEAEAMAAKIVADAERLRANTAREGAARLERAEKAAAILTAAAAAAGSQFEDVLDTLRAPADALASALAAGTESVEHEMAALRAGLGSVKPAVARRDEEKAKPVAEEPVSEDLPGPDDEVGAARISIVEPAAVPAVVGIVDAGSHDPVADIRAALSAPEAVDLDTQEHDSLEPVADEDADADELWFAGD